MEIHTWLLFCSVAFVATFTPGPAILLAISHSLSHGLGKTTFTILGNVSGLFILSSLSIAGLSVIILSSSLIFFFVKLAGSIYLIYMGINLWRNGFNLPASPTNNQKATENIHKLYFHGFGVAMSNPKAIAFTTALFPQFINQQSALLPQFFVLLISFMLLSSLCLFFYGYIASQTKVKLSNSKFPIVSKLLGTGFVVSGVTLLSTSQKNV